VSFVEAFEGGSHASACCAPGCSWRVCGRNFVMPVGPTCVATTSGALAPPHTHPHTHTHTPTPTPTPPRTHGRATCSWPPPLCPPPALLDSASTHPQGGQAGRRTWACRGRGSGSAVAPSIPQLRLAPSAAVGGAPAASHPTAAAASRFSIRSRSATSHIVRSPLSRSFLA
jgi:hypothetical protein